MHIVRNAEKHEIIQILETLKDKSECFNAERDQDGTDDESNQCQERFLVGITWIGHLFRPTKLTHHDTLAEELGIKCPEKSADGTEYL